MRILIVSARYYPESFSITNIAESFVKKGHQVTVLTGVPNYGKWKIYDEFIYKEKQVINKVNVIRVKEKPRTKGLFGLIKNYLSIYCQFKKYIKKLPNDFDVVLSHVISPIFAISGLEKFCKKFRIPHIHYGLDIWPESLVTTGYLKRQSCLFKFFKRVSRNIYNSCDVISFASPSVETYLKDYLKIDEAIPFKQIYQPCLTKLPDFEIKSKENKIHILYCGSITKFTHLDIFLHGFKNFTNGDIVFDIVGSGSDEERLKNLIKKENIQNVIFHGRVAPNETINFYKNADFLYVSLFNNSATSKMIPQKVIEYFMYGKPIFGMIVGDGADLIKASSNLNIVVDQNPDAINDGLNRCIELFNENEKYLKCCKDNRIFFENNKRFQLDTISDELLEIMHDSIGKADRNF